MKVDLIYDVGGDWVALYINGVLKYQGHSITDDNWKEILMSLNVQVNDYQEANFADSGSAPMHLADMEIVYG